MTGGLDPDRVDAGEPGLAGGRPLSARSVIASTLLGVEPPALPSRELVRAGELFGIAEGTVRVALSRMVSAGELAADDGWYRLTGRLLDRQARQSEGRHPQLRTWDGDWSMWIVEPVRRSAADRSELRNAMRALRAAELREGVWLRPDNLDPDRLAHQQAVATSQCRSFVARPEGDSTDGELAAELWDLDSWASIATLLEGEMAAFIARLEHGEVDALAPAWELSAAVLRHLVADPLLPSELLPATWPGDDLRAAYDRYDVAFKQLWRQAFVEV